MKNRRATRKLSVGTSVTRNIRMTWRDRHPFRHHPDESRIVPLPDNRAVCRRNPARRSRRYPDRGYHAVDQQRVEDALGEIVDPDCPDPAVWMRFVRKPGFGGGIAPPTESLVDIGTKCYRGPPTAGKPASPLPHRHKTFKPAPRRVCHIGPNERTPGVQDPCWLSKESPVFSDRRGPSAAFRFPFRVAPLSA